MQDSGTKPHPKPKYFVGPQIEILLLYPKSKP